MKKGIFIALAYWLVNGLLGQTADSFYRNAPMINYDFIEPATYKIRNVVAYEVNNKPFSRSNTIFATGLSVGQLIRIPGPEITNAIKKIWELEYFSDVQVFFQTADDGSVVVQFRVEEQPRLSGHRFLNLRNENGKTLREEVGLKQGMYITPDLINQSKAKIIKHYKEKGFYNAKVEVLRRQGFKKGANDSIIILPGYENFDFDVKPGLKVKVQSVEFTGNEKVTSEDLTLQIKDFKPLVHKFKFWKSSKFIDSKFEDERGNIIKYYLSKGFRDARIISDSVELISENRIVLHIHLYEGHQYRFGKIRWKGNLKYRTGLLDTMLSIKPGDLFNQIVLNEKLSANLNGYDISSLYMDDGYLSFQIQPMEVGVNGDSIDIDIMINEGLRATIGKVFWKGNTKTSDRVIQREVRTKPGDVFSKSDIQRTMRDLGALGLFDPAQMNVNPKTNARDGTVDIEYILAEKPSDQIELSGGYGGNGYSRTPTLIGTAGIMLNNFSRRKLLSPETWSPVPTGDGQKLSLRAQSNGANYQGYTFSFSEPWFGGKKPNNLSVMMNHTVNSFDYRLKTDPLHQSLTSTT